MQRPFIHPYAYSVLILLFTAITTAVSIYCCYYFTATTAIKLLLLIIYVEQDYSQVQLNWQLRC